MAGIAHDRPIALYNSDVPELMGVFRHPIHATKYIFGKQARERASYIGTSIRQKARLLNTIFPHPVAARFANDTQMILLGDLDFHITEKYPQITGDLKQYSGFTGLENIHTTKRGGTGPDTDRRAEHMAFIKQACLTIDGPITAPGILANLSPGARVSSMVLYKLMRKITFLKMMKRQQGSWPAEYEMIP